MADGSQGFLGRWSRRTQEVREGVSLEEPAKPSPQPSPASGRGGQSISLGRMGEQQPVTVKENET